jgi:hypothetical protein
MAGKPLTFSNAGGELSPAILTTFIGTLHVAPKESFAIVNTIAFPAVLIYARAGFPLIMAKSNLTVEEGKLANDGDHDVPF